MYFNIKLNFKVQKKLKILKQTNEKNNNESEMV